MNRKEIAKKIREELKEKGISSKQVGVRSSRAGYDGCIDITIKDSDVQYGLIKRIADKYKVIHEDYKGEILEGSNLYIDIYD